MFKNFVMKNQYQSSKLCEALYTTCEDKMDQLQVLRLPSMAKFNAGFLHCNQSFEKECVGPSKTIYEQRMVKVRTFFHVNVYGINKLSSYPKTAIYSWDCKMGGSVGWVALQNGFGLKLIIS